MQRTISFSSGLETDLNHRNACFDIDSPQKQIHTGPIRGAHEEVAPVVDIPKKSGGDLWKHTKFGFGLANRNKR